MPRPKGSKNKSTLLKEEEARKKALSTPPDEINTSDKIKVGSTTYVNGITSDDIADRQKINAREKNQPDPDFDFRLTYTPKDIIYFVAAYPHRALSVIKLSLRTIYARSMVGVDEYGQCIAIGYSDIESIFSDNEQARQYCKSLVRIKEEQYED